MMENLEELWILFQTIMEPARGLWMAFVSLLQTMFGPIWSMIIWMLEYLGG